MNFKKFDIVKFYGINQFVETGIIKEVIRWDDTHTLYTIQTLDLKSHIYFGELKILTKINEDFNFDFSNLNFHNYSLKTILYLKYSKQFANDYTIFYHNNFGNGLGKQIDEFTNIYQLKENEIYQLKLDNYDGRYSYICTLNNHSNFIIHENFFKNHVV